MYRAAIEYYTELIQKFEEWIKYLKNGGNSNLVESFLERENIRGAEDINYNTRPSSNRITNLKVTQTFIEEEDGKPKEVEKVQQIKAFTIHSTLIGLDNEEDGKDAVKTNRVKAIEKYYELIEAIKEAQRRQEEAQRRQEEAQRRQEEAQRRQEEAQRKHIGLLETYLKKLIQSEKYKHWCTFDNDKYIWYSERGSKRDLVLFLEAVYQILNINFQNYKYLEKYFGVRGLRQYKNACIQKGYWDPKIKEIKEFLLK